MSVSYQYLPQQQQLNIYVTGSLNFSKVDKFRDIYDQVTSVEHVIVDLEATDIIDSSGLGILLYLKSHYNCDRSRVELINCNNTVHKTFNMAQFQKLFSYS